MRMQSTCTYLRCQRDAWPAPPPQGGYSIISRPVLRPTAAVPPVPQGTSERFKHRDSTKDQPGVGSYAVNNNAMGKQTLSQKKTLPSPKIGTGQRDAFKRVGGCQRRGWGPPGEGRVFLWAATT